MDDEAMRPRAVEALKAHWGHADFRPGQWEAIETVLAERDALAVLPTGGGKSVCYQLPALLGDGLTLVISPLIALMQDQVAGLKARGVPAACINSTLSTREIDQCWTDAEHGRYRLLYVAPERLQSELFVARAARLRVSLLAVDEAHCISEWGQHFRPAYRRIAEARRLLGGPPTIAVTATATPEVRKDIVEHLALRDPSVVVRGFDRPNIVWSIFRGENKRAKALDVVRGVEGSGILYASTRARVEEWARWLKQQGETAAAYHGGLRAAEREAVQEAWMRGETRLMVATNAFGMGVDKPDVRFVVHVDVPSTLEGYYQEAGRGGRDGHTAYAVLLFRREDAATQHALIEDSHPDGPAVRAVYDAVCNLAQIPLGSVPEEPVQVDRGAVARLTGLSPGKIGTAVELLARQETWSMLPVRRHFVQLRFTKPADAVRAYAERLENQALAGFLQALLRTVHADAFSSWWEMDLRVLESRTRLDRPRLLRGLAFLEQHDFFEWRPPGDALRVQLREARAQRLPVDDLLVRRARRRAEARLETMLRYAGSVTCRRRFLLTYFGEASPERCGSCDVCLGRHQGVVVTPREEPLLRHILHQVSADVERERWFEADAPADHELDGLVDWLVQEGYLRPREPLAEAFSVTEKARAFMEQWEPRR